MVMTSVYFLSIPGEDSPMEISQDDLRSLLGEIETKLHRSKAYRRALATMQKSLGDSSEPVNQLLKSVGREAISVAFQYFIQAHKKIVESNKQADNQSEKVAVKPGNSTELSQCFTDVNPNKISPNTTTNKVDSLPESNMAVNTADYGVKLR